VSIVLFDTNLWVSAIHFRGLPLEALRVCIAHDTPLTCFQLEEEITCVLSEKFKHREANVRAKLNVMLEDALRVPITGNLNCICRDPNDDFLLECALTGNADFIVTGDKDLLSLQSFRGIPIVTPRQYLDQIDAPL
jgi:putative PIN family toxin of toxin-antitoxin system